MLAVEPPGRAARSKEQQYSSLQQLAAALLPVVASRLADGTPYVVVAHSLGTWMAFELLQLVRQAGLPLPSAAWLSAMPSPDIPLGQRPWRQQRSLGEQQFKVSDPCWLRMWVYGCGWGLARTAQS
jgi:medium-chain acyl-[acyl-carrier-protein] hydrolase